MSGRTPAQTLTAAADKVDTLLAGGYAWLEATDSAAVASLGTDVLPALAALLRLYATAPPAISPKILALAAAILGAES